MLDKERTVKQTKKRIYSRWRKNIFTIAFTWINIYIYIQKITFRFGRNSSNVFMVKEINLFQINWRYKSKFKTTWKMLRYVVWMKYIHVAISMIKKWIRILNRSGKMIMDFPNIVRRLLKIARKTFCKKPKSSVNIDMTWNAECSK